MSSASPGNVSSPSPAVASGGFALTTAWYTTVPPAASAGNGTAAAVALPAPQGPAQSSGSAAAGLSGAISSALFALLVSFAAVALTRFARLSLAPARWRPLAFVAVIERPG
jgi:hypothetical protein